MIVDLNPSEEQRQLIDSTEVFLGQELPLDRLRRDDALASLAERRVWQSLAELGLFGLGLPEEVGGAGLGVAEELLVGRSLGRRILSPSVLATLLAAHLAYRSGDVELTRQFIEGSAIASFAQPVSKSRAHLIDSTTTDWLLLLAPTVRLLPASARREVRAAKSMDESLGLEEATVIADTGDAADIDDRVALLLSAYLVGIADAALQMATAYALTREQFGQPIGAFQAIKHLCADMALRSLGAEAQCFFTGVTWSAGRKDAPVEIGATRYLARQAAVCNAKDNIQVHGAMGFTAECEAHFFLKRSLVVANLAGSPAVDERLLLGR